MADDKDEKRVEVELLDDLMKYEGEFYHAGDKVSLPKSSYDRLVKFGSVRDWSSKGKQSSDTKAARSVEGQTEKSAKDDAEHSEPAEAVAVARVEGQSSKQQAQQRR